MVFWFDIFWYSFVHTVLCLFCNNVCSSLIDNNLQNICHIFYKKYYLPAHTRWGRGCWLKVNVYVQRVQGGGGSEHMYFIDHPHHHSHHHPFSTSYLMYFKQVMFFIAELRGKFVSFVCWKAKLPKKKPLSTIFKYIAEK